MGEPINEKIEKSFKILLLGDSSVGKTCFLKRYIDDTFQDVYLSTIGFDYKYKFITLEDGKKIKLQIWDTAGQERFRTIGKGYYKGAHGIILIYDVTSQKSFDSIKTWLNEIKSEASNKVCVFLVANKIDIEERLISREDGEEIAKNNNLEFYESSAKDNINVSEVFQDLAEKINEKYKIMKEKGKKLDEIIPEKTKGKKKKCC
jgi:Ras-related protein Rab-1A